MKSKQVALVSIFASLYVTLGFVLQNIAFGPVQIRFADALYPLIAVFGWPMLVATFLGHLIFNIYGFGAQIALGVGDLASPFIFLIPKYLIYKFGNPTKVRLVLTTSIHVLFVAFWVAWLLYSLGYQPFFWLGVLTVGIGETIAEIVFGVPLTLMIKRRFGYGRSQL